MKDLRYERIASNHKASENKGKNGIVAFVSGGILGALAEGLINFYSSIFDISRNDATSIMIVTFIFIASLFTALGFFDKLVNRFKCGLLIPITGFAHAMTSSAMDYKKEGLVYGIGMNIFKLAGSVILYGVVAAWFFGMIRYFIGGAL